MNFVVASLLDWLAPEGRTRLITDGLSEVLGQAAIEPDQEFPKLEVGGYALAAPETPEQAVALTIFFKCPEAVQNNFLEKGTEMFWQRQYLAYDKVSGNSSRVIGGRDE